MYRLHQLKTPWPCPIPIENAVLRELSTSTERLTLFASIVSAEHFVEIALNMYKLRRQIRAQRYGKRG